MPASLRKIERLQSDVQRLQRGIMSPATERGYSHDWRTFTRWCETMGLSPLPASTGTLALFVADLLDRKKKVSTVARYVFGVAHKHVEAGFPSPLDAAVKRMLQAARRLRCEQPRQMKPLTVAQLRKIADQLAALETPLGSRDRAIMVLGFASALRRSSLARLELQDVAFQPEGVLLYIRQEKQDRRGDGRLLGVPYGQNLSTCPVRSLQAWLKFRGGSHGPLFTRLDNGRASDLDRLTPDAIAEVVKKAIRGAGLDTALFNSHSLRSGLITEAAIRGVHPMVIATQSGHKNLDTLKRYFRPVELFKTNAAAMVGL